MKKIDYACFINNTGFGHAARGYLRCLIDLGHQIRVKPLHSMTAYPWLDEGDKSMLNSGFVGEADVSIWHSIPSRWGGLRKGRDSNFLICTFECSSPPLDWIKSINGTGTHAVYPSNFCKNVFNESGVILPHSVIHHVVPDVFFNSYPRGYPGYGFKFLSVGAWKSRKNWSNIILGFQKSLEDGLDAHLIIKTDRTALARSELAKLVHRKFSHKFSLVDGDLSDQGMAGLYASVDGFICASRGEGFCLPVAQAMAAGLLVISTQSGGLMDYFDDSVGVVIPQNGFEKQSMDNYPQFSSKNWPVITSDSVGRAVSEACEKYQYIHRTRGEKARQRAKIMFSKESVAAKLSDMIENK